MIMNEKIIPIRSGPERIIMWEHLQEKLKNSYELIPPFNQHTWLVVMSTEVGCTPDEMQAFLENRAEAQASVRPRISEACDRTTFIYERKNFEVDHTIHDD